MQAANAPSRVEVPFADSGTKNAIPVDSQIGITPGAASYTTGFPPLTFTPVSAGGIPPFGADFNGIFFDITARQQWQAAGGGYTYNSDFATAIGGYPKGAILLRADLLGFWMSTADNNMTDPDGGSPSNWVAGPRVGAPYHLVFTTSTTWVVPAGVTRIKYTVTGGGGGGGGCQGSSAAQTFSGAGGAGAGTAIGYMNVAPGASISVVIGAGGNGSSDATSGANGGTSSLGSISAPGGVGAQRSGATSTSGGEAVAVTGGDINISGGDGSDGQSGDVLVGGNGGGSFWGGGGRAGAVGGVAAKAYGAGGGGAYDTGFSGSAYSGGAGKQGIVIIEIA